ncbi:MAG: zinc-dependent alcohol dehydrogenase [Ilumatobacteraceae bacterium]|nr:zinc-dependent alcohol dehydrogenase [Ilumatobacteraceae bacterium]
MKASFFDHHGLPDVLRFGEVPDPVPNAGEVLVEVRAASVNGADWRIRQGDEVQVSAFPYILGRDFSGIVTAVTPNSGGWNLGDEVFGVRQVRLDGAYAQLLASDGSILARKPPGLSHIEAASIALAGLTALVSIESTLALQSSESVLIHGGAGGVGTIAVQLAKHLGAYVISTASASNCDYVQSLGADVVIDYAAHDFTQFVEDLDAVLDTVSPEVAARSFNVLKPGGRLASITSFVALTSPRDDVRSLRPDVVRNRHHLERVADLVTSGAIDLPAITVFPLADAAAAHRLSQGRHLRGKLVLDVAADDR